MKFAVDEIIDDRVIIQNLETGEVFSILKKDILGSIYDGVILRVKGKYYVPDLLEEKKRRELLQEKFLKVGGKIDETL